VQLGGDVPDIPAEPALDKTGLPHRVEIVRARPLLAFLEKRGNFGR
jgi:hypothetical protein